MAAGSTRIEARELIGKSLLLLKTLVKHDARLREAIHNNAG